MTAVINAQRVRNFLRRARVSQPLNRLATSTTRAFLDAFGIESDFVVRHLHRAGTVRCELPNGRVRKLWSRGDDWVSTQLYWKGLSGYEPETVSVFLRHARTARVVLDIGAYVGFYALLAAHANPEGRVFAFEPHPDAYARLVWNVKLNGLENIQCVAAAAGATSGIAELYGVPGWLPTSSSTSLEFMRPHGELRRMPVRMITLDAFVRDHQIVRVDLLKIDTESTEAAVLRGMVETIRRDRPTIVCEVLAGQSDEGALEALLAPLGYRYYLLTAGGPERQTRIVGHPEWLNYLFTCVEPA